LANFPIYLAIGHTAVETKKNITFKTGMPDDALIGEDCVHMWGDIGEWNDIHCHSNIFETMCEAVFNCS
jgi:hypothetical protein